MTTQVADAVYRQIVQEAPDAIVLATTDGTMLVWNAGAERIFGYFAQEAIGQGLDMIIPESQRDQHWTGYDKVLAAGSTQYASQPLAVTANHKSGKRISLEMTFALLKDTDGKVTHVAALIRDVSARVQRDIELRRKLAALEKQVLGQSTAR